MRLKHTRDRAAESGPVDLGVLVVHGVGDPAPGSSLDRLVGGLDLRSNALELERQGSFFLDDKEEREPYDHRVPMFRFPVWQGSWREARAITLAEVNWTDVSSVRHGVVGLLKGLANVLLGLHATVNAAGGLSPELGRSEHAKAWKEVLPVLHRAYEGVFWIKGAVLGLFPVVVVSGLLAFSLEAAPWRAALEVLAFVGLSVLAYLLERVASAKRTPVTFVWAGSLACVWLLLPMGWSAERLFWQAAGMWTIGLAITGVLVVTCGLVLLWTRRSWKADAADPKAKSHSFTMLAAFSGEASLWFLLTPVIWWVLWRLANWPLEGHVGELVVAVGGLLWTLALFAMCLTLLGAKWRRGSSFKEAVDIGLLACAAVVFAIPACLWVSGLVGTNLVGVDLASTLALSGWRVLTLLLICGVFVAAQERARYGVRSMCEERERAVKPVEEPVAGDGRDGAGQCRVHHLPDPFRLRVHVLIPWVIVGYCVLLLQGWVARLWGWDASLPDWATTSLGPFLFGMIGLGVLLVAWSSDARELLRLLLDLALDALAYFRGRDWQSKGIVSGKQRMHHRFEQGLAALSRGGRTRVLVLAHSLGSVIVFDVLRQKPHLAEKVSTLVTMGSPLHDLFNKFFPRDYPDPDHIRDELVGVSRWVNLYREWDYVGRALSVEDKPLGEGYHSDYWHDERALEVLEEEIDLLCRT